MADEKVTDMAEKTAPIGEDLLYLVDDPTGSPIQKQVKLTNLISSPINNATAKSTPVDADVLGIVDSAASNILKKFSWFNMKATLKTYLDTLYAPMATKTEVDNARDGETNLLAQIDSLQALIVANTPIKNNYTLTCTPTTSGTITLQTGLNTLTYYQVGKLVTVIGRVYVLSVSSPVGVGRFNLPAQASNDGAEVDISGNVHGYGFSLGSGTTLNVLIDYNQNYFTIVEGGISSPVTILPAAGSTFRFGFSYIAA